MRRLGMLVKSIHAHHELRIKASHLCSFISSGNTKSSTTSHSMKISFIGLETKRHTFYLMRTQGLFFLNNIM